MTASMSSWSYWPVLTRPPRPDPRTWWIQNLFAIEKTITEYLRTERAGDRNAERQLERMIGQLAARALGLQARVGVAPSGALVFEDWTSQPSSETSSTAD